MSALLAALLGTTPTGPAQEPSWTPEPWVQAGYVLARRDATWWGASAILRGGLTTPSGVRLGLEVDWGWPRPLVEAGGERSMQPVDLLAGAHWSAGGAWSPTLGTLLGVSCRHYAGPSFSGWVATPVLGFEAGVAIPVWGERLALVPVARVFGDLRRTEVQVAGEPRQLLSAVEIQGGLTLMVPPP